MLTRSLTFKFFKFVNFKVWGITFISKYPFLILDIVNDTPFTEIEAFSINWLNKFLFLIINLIIQVLSIIEIFLTIAVVSTWPWT